MTPLNRNQIAWRAAQGLREGWYVNLGMGTPVLAANYAPKDADIMFQSENGIVGVGPVAAPGEEDPDYVDAGSQKITLREGASLVDSAMSFAMIRGGHIDVTMLGGFQVSSSGDLANWDAMIPNKGPLVGGAMDLAVGAKSVWVVMAHLTREGEPRLVEKCSYPETGIGVVDWVYTDHAVVQVTPDGFLVHEIIEGLSREGLQGLTAAPLSFAPDCRVLDVPAL
ncbi:MAG: 3-oxoacid CoA-transferase subunit B [Proteobacteria bacterium]|jgi:3-oxoadipate CoA-transferase, beta subunit|nr:3-oxoacid CoA-transferase subunit B [Pseudomonadota bacterium]